MISEDFAFFGFDETSWNRLVSLFVGDGEEKPSGVIIVVVDATGKPVASFHTAEGSTDPATLGPIDDLESLCAAHQASACVVMRERAMADIELYLAEPLGPDRDFVTRVMRFVRVVRQLGNGNWLRVWPNPLPDLLLSAAPVAKPASDLLLPHGHSVILGVFEENGDLWTSAVLRRDVAELDVLAGPRALSDWAGPLGGEWRRDHRVLVRAVERELGPVHLGLFMEAPTARRLVRGRGAGDWAMAFVTRDLLIHPLPAFAAAGLGLDVLAGAAQQIAQTLEQMESEELVSIAQGFWRGLTDGRGLEGLLGFSPKQVLSEALDRISAAPPPDAPDSEEPPDPDASP
ncbi:MAG: hypothetical protein AMJ62_04360 [Myxococcales bacterium SG8_38]|nr:MAG: hypothetical protein AMJ62_04360 [Myxococcales bacterium SG8_38]